jgi:hypothetical protein
MYTHKIALVAMMIFSTMNLNASQKNYAKAFYPIIAAQKTLWLDEKIEFYLKFLGSLPPHSLRIHDELFKDDLCKASQSEMTIPLAMLPGSN